MDLTGTTIGQYDIIEQIGRGGMSTVYKAHQPSLDRYVAIKVLPSDLAQVKDFRTRFEREARAIARLRHRNILTIFEDGGHKNVFYLVMEYVSGGTLQERLGWPQDLGYVVNIVSQVGDALAHAHQQGIIHRDVKPGNILMAWEDWPLLSDFGLAKMVEDSLHLTLGGASVGTPHYMSPEQAQGLPVDHRSDIYSLGVVLYEAVTGRRPFGTDNAVAIIFKHVNDPITSPRTLRSDLPEEMERVILKALAKDRDDRYQRMEEFLADLQKAYPLHAGAGANQPNHVPAKAKKPAAGKRKSKSRTSTPLLPARRSFPWAGLALSISLLVIVILGVLFFRDSMGSYVSAFTEAVAAAAAPLAAGPAQSPAAAGPSPTNAGLSPTRPRPSPTAAPPTATLSNLAAAPTASPTGSEASPTALSSPDPASTSADTSIPAPLPTVTVKVWGPDGAEMVFVPAGEFVMGSDQLGDDEQPVRRVLLDDFWIDRYEVTNERFARFVAETGYQTEAEQRGWGWVRVGDDWEEVEGADWRHPRTPDNALPADKSDHPVVLISWNDADAYCRWAGKRLPTEAEWEKAARGPLLDKGYAWGELFDRARTNTRESELGGTTPVGSFSPQGDSLYGAADMTGNVGEWVADWYSSDYYSQAPAANPPGPTSGTYRVLRGGSWLFDELYARTAFRYNIRPDYTYDFTGFRCSSQ